MCKFRMCQALQAVVQFSCMPSHVICVVTVLEFRKIFLEKVHVHTCIYACLKHTNYMKTKGILTVMSH